ncbi:aldo/keto reductase [Wenxinia marina]|uniref:Putative oxidoreductase n=1 Tax=Wenxinia marina DSM 24838 TaxID=1123501 RepID=A0A0D0QFK1_9RHOB|nr:aldo/keto reductase [Wenxinia marina]KIQ69773.1 putative oxidoreductase [Wenxinia marina DSM 24838]GGL61065.1 oxidoreductase [Wenxinia marina]
MNKHPLGRTGLQVTPICFGGSALGGMPGTYGYDVDEARARATVEAILDGPVNFLDTSRNYGLGRSEERIGAVIRDRGLPEGFVLATKLDRDMETGRFDADRVRRSLEESLTALGVERIDLLHLHDPEHARDLNEITRTGGALDELFRLKEEGLATAVGLAMGRLDIMEPLVRERPFDVILNHNRFTLLNRASEALFDDARARGMAVLNAAPFAGGVLAKGADRMKRVTYQEASEEALKPVRRIEEICARHGIDPGAAALQFSMRDPRIASTVIGVSRPERVTQTLDWAAAEIPQAAWDELLALPASDRDPEADRVYRPG